MNLMLFLDKCREVLPPAKDLTPTQWAAYREKLSRFTEDELQRIYDSVLENCRYFPKIADVYEQAKLLGLTERKMDYRPHAWTATGCQSCEGSGLVAAFWSQEFDLSETEKIQVLRLHYLIPYHTSGIHMRANPSDDVRSVYRCFCAAGTAETLDKGIPRWTEQTPQTMRKSWAA